MNWFGCHVWSNHQEMANSPREDCVLMEILARLIGWCLHHTKSLLNFFRVEGETSRMKGNHQIWDIYEPFFGAIGPGPYLKDAWFCDLPSDPWPTGSTVSSWAEWSHAWWVFFWSIIGPSKSLQLPPQMLCNPLQAQSSWSRELLPEGGCPVWVEGSTELESAF